MASDAEYSAKHNWLTRNSSAAGGFSVLRVGTATACVKEDDKNISYETYSLYQGIC